MKICKRCEKLLPLSAFDRATSSKDGRYPTCRRCYDLSRTPNTMCVVCHTPFYAQPSRLKRGQGRYCSFPCKSIAFGTVQRLCAYCTHPFPVTASAQHRPHHGKYCSELCFYRGRRLATATRSRKRCPQCQRIKPLHAFHHRNMKGRSERCSVYCKRCKRRIDKLWRLRSGYLGYGTKKRRDRLRDAPAEPILLASIYVRDGGRCQICHKKTLPLTCRDSRHPKAPTIDHIVPVNDDEFLKIGHVRTNVRLAHFGCNASRCDGRIPAQLLLIG